MKTWRDHCAPIIAEILHETAGDVSAQKKALRAAYPYGERTGWPYKVWLSEIKRQTAKKTLPTFNLPLFE